MRTLLLTLVCIGIGFGIAKIQHDQRIAKIENFLGPAEGEIDAAINAALAKSESGRIEVVNGEDLDFGTMMKGTKRSHTFVFKNVGTANVDVWYKSSTCKCTVGKLDRKTLVPNETVDVALEWLAEGGIDEFAQTATIGSTAPDQEEIKLTIHGKIGRNFVFDPPSHNIGDFLSSQETVINGKLYSFEETPLNVSTIAWPDAVLSKKIHGEVVEIKKLEKNEVPEFADARYCLDFKIIMAPGIPAGPVSGNIVLARSSGVANEEPELLSYHITGRCVTPIRIIAGPDYNERRNIFDLGSAKSSEGLKKSFMIGIKNEDASKINLRVGKVIPKDHLKVTIGEPKVSDVQKIYPITLEVPPGSPPLEFGGSFSKDFGKIVLESDMEIAPQIPMFIKLRITE